MGSQIDLDQGGTSRSWNKVYMGPSVGWIWIPDVSVLPITTAGTYILDPSTNYVTVSAAGLVTIVLPSVKAPASGAITQSNLSGQSPVTIVDTGGNAGAFPITIQRNNSNESIMGLSQIQITVNFGGYTLAPSSSQLTWNPISP